MDVAVEVVEVAEEEVVPQEDHPEDPLQAEQSQLTYLTEIEYSTAMLMEANTRYTNKIGNRRRLS